MIQLPYLANLIDNLKKSSIDDFADRLCYYTTLLLVFFAILVGARNYTAPIECMMPAEFPGTWENYAKEYCYISSTYTVISGINNEASDTRVAHGYYQWVAFFLVVQGLLIYSPNIAWKIFLSTQAFDFKHIVEKAKELRFVMGEDYQKGLKDIRVYLKERLRYQGTKNGISNTGFGMKSAIVHAVAKILTIMIIMFELSFMNKNFGPDPDMFWGLTMIKQGLTNDHWNVTGIFPRLTFCDFNQPILGNMRTQRTVQCVLPHNMMNEKIFIFTWLWLAAVLMYSIGDIAYFVFSLFTPSRRYKSAYYFIQSSLKNSEDVLQPSLKNVEDVFENDDEKDKEKIDMVNFAKDMFGPDGIYLLDCIKVNAGSLIAVDIATQIVEELYVKPAPPPPKEEEIVKI